MKLNLGCGDDIRDGYINVDIIEKKGVTKKDLVEYLIRTPNNTIDEIVFQDVLEHFPHGIIDTGTDLEYKPINNVVTSLLLIEMAVVKLKKGGKLYIRVPDLQWVCKKIGSGEFNWDRSVWTLFGGQKDRFDYHLSGWTAEKLKSLLEDLKLSDIKVSRIIPNIVAEAIKK